MSKPQGAIEFRVSRRGQFSLPADARRRWGLADGGSVEVFDLGEAVVVLPTGVGSARRSLAAALTAQRYDELIEAIEDPELLDQ